MPKKTNKRFRKRNYNRKKSIKKGGAAALANLGSYIRLRQRRHRPKYPYPYLFA